MSLYSFARDAKAELLVVTIDGLMPPDVAVQFAQELGGQVAAALASGEKLKMLIDASKAPVQQLASFTEISKLGERFGDVTIPTAVVMGSNLAKMQADRGIVTPDVRSFLSKDEALAWLTAL